MPDPVTVAAVSGAAGAVAGQVAADVLKPETPPNPPPTPPAPGEPQTLKADSTPVIIGSHEERISNHDDRLKTLENLQNGQASEENGITPEPGSLPETVPPQEKDPWTFFDESDTPGPAANPGPAVNSGPSPPDPTAGSETG